MNPDIQEAKFNLKIMFHCRHACKCDKCKQDMKKAIPGCIKRIKKMEKEQANASN